MRVGSWNVNRRKVPEASVQGTFLRTNHVEIVAIQEGNANSIAKLCEAAEFDWFYSAVIAGKGPRQNKPKKTEPKGSVFTYFILKLNNPALSAMPSGNFASNGDFMNHTGHYYEHQYRTHTPKDAFDRALLGCKGEDRRSTFE